MSGGFNQGALERALHNIHSRNGKVLQSFVTYCMTHPDERFWQALRNWSGAVFIRAWRQTGLEDEGEDTFYWEGRDK
jgi:hypothetical protein